MAEILAIAGLLVGLAQLGRDYFGVKGDWQLFKQQVKAHQWIWWLLLLVGCGWFVCGGTTQKAAIEKDLQQIVQNKAVTDVDAFFRKHTTAPHARVKRQLADGSLMDETDLKSYLWSLLVQEPRQIHVQEVQLADNQQIKMIIITTIP